MEGTSTAALTQLQACGVPFSVHRYAYNPDANLIGMQAAQALGVDPERLLKTLMVMVDRQQPVCLVVPAAHKVDLKRVAGLFGGRNARMIPAQDAETLTGYKVGGISPFGQSQPVPVVFDASAMDKDHVFINAGDRGMVVKISPQHACQAVHGRTASISAP